MAMGKRKRVLLIPVYLCLFLAVGVSNQARRQGWMFSILIVGITVIAIAGVLLAVHL
jgi:hypothetical protein